MSNIDPQLSVRKAPHGPTWSVWMTPQLGPSEEIFEGSSEEEVTRWITNNSTEWLQERRRKRSA